MCPPQLNQIIVDDSLCFIVVSQQYRFEGHLLGGLAEYFSLYHLSKYMKL